MKNTGHPRTIGRYKVTGILGHGGMSTVYRAVMPATGKVVALKLLDPAEALTEVLDMKTLREIFTAEVLAMSRLRHPNIADVWDFDFDGGRPFYTMEYFCNNLGMMIGERFIVEESSRQVPPEKVTAYGSQILQGLQCMHSAGIFHRDIKPFNMLVSNRDTIKICDFGMARMEGQQSFGAEGLHIGSPYYTAPEQIQNPENADARSDLYATGALLYRMLTGELPAMKGFMLSRVNPLFDDGWDAFFTRALSWNPDLRFQDASEMQAELLQLEVHWERRKKVACRPDDQGGETDGMERLRTTPVRVSGVKAMAAFCVNRLWQPDSYVENIFTDRNKYTVADAATGLIWQRKASDYPLDREEAAELVKVLSEITFGGMTGWRLPTVNELLSLANDPIVPENACHSIFLCGHSDWFWSCDRRSRDTSWYVNTRLSFAGWQDDGCRYFVRAVADLPIKDVW